MWRGSHAWTITVNQNTFTRSLWWNIVCYCTISITISIISTIGSITSISIRIKTDINSIQVLKNHLIDSITRCERWAEVNKGDFRWQWHWSTNRLFSSWMNPLWVRCCGEDFRETTNNKISSKYLLYAISCELQILKTFQCVFLRNIIHCIFLRYFTTCISQIFQCVFLRSALACVAHMFRGWHWAAKVG